MSINWKTPIKDFNDNEIKEGDKVMTLDFLAMRAIDANLPGDDKLPAETKIERFDTMLRIKNNGVMEKADLKLIRERMALVYTPWIYGFCSNLLDVPAKEVAKEGG